MYYIYFVKRDKTQTDLVVKQPTGPIDSDSLLHSLSSELWARPFYS